jgi:hypothetical protein
MTWRRCIGIPLYLLMAGRAQSIVASALHDDWPNDELNRGTSSYDLANCAVDARHLRLPRLRPYQAREVLRR